MIFGGLCFLGLNYFFQNTSSISIPEPSDFNVSKLNEAKSLLKNMGLNVIEFGSGDLERIVPAPGTVVKKGRKVQIFGKSFTEKNYIIPNLFGINYIDGINILTKLKLKVNITKIKYPGPDGRILSTYPEPGSVIFENQCINVLIDNGDFGGM